ncbi:MAG: biotin biosynthesis protein BioY [Gaiellaceae bacterium]|jgi:biotin transport system substrate-specific component|nr:MAG: biotin biosynthesis protein BioY [Gaiellaceae bacterium]GIU94836.1 MAG: biotin biosynthesis protein BioY [Gaiellaceae bacterium]
MSAEATTLRSAALPHAGRLVDALLVVAGAGLIAASAQIAIPLPFTPVPITGQTFSVLLVGAALGTTRGGASGLLYVLAGALGAPVYAEGSGGLAALTGPTGGYLLAFPVAAALTGRLAERRWDRRFSSSLGALLTGNVVVYLIGLPWLAVSLDTSLERTLELGLYPFVPGDVLKLYLAAVTLPAAWRVVGSRTRR